MSAFSSQARQLGSVQPDDGDPIVEMDRALNDGAIELQRRNRPKDVTDKRAQKRYSIAELNALDVDTLRERFKNLSPVDDRPGVIRFLDIIDAPRNAFANTLASSGAIKLAQDRGDFGAGGQLKVYGSDVLRSLGINNRVITGLGGFALDVVTDPLSWIGAPIGGLAVKGSKGAIQIGATGQRTLRAGLRDLSRGRAVSDDATRELFDAVTEVGRASGQSFNNSEEVARYVSKELLQSESILTKGVVPRIGLPQTTKGGRLAEDVYKPVAGSVDGVALDIPAHEARARKAVSDWISKHTSNRGFAIGGEKGTALAHIPLTDITLYGPAWTRNGRQAVYQRAIAAAQTGDIAKSASLSMLQGFNDELGYLSDIQTSLKDQSKILDDSIARASSPDELADITQEKIRLAERSDAIASRIAEMPATIERARNANLANNAAGYGKIEDIGDLKVAAELSSRVHAQARQLADDIVAAPSRTMIQQSRDRLRGAKELVEEEVDWESLTDPLAPIDARTDEFNKLLDNHIQSQDDTIASLMRLSDESAVEADRAVDALSKHFDSTARLAALMDVPFFSLLRDSTDRNLASAAGKMIGLGDDLAGHMPLASIKNALNIKGPSTTENIFAALQQNVARGFGVPDSAFDHARASLMRIVQHGAAEKGREFVHQMLNGGEGSAFSKGLARIAADHNLGKDGLEPIAMVALAKYHQKYQPKAAGYWGASAAGEETAASRFLQSAKAEGIINNPDAMLDIDRWADEFKRVHDELGEVSIDNDLLQTLVPGYAPVALTPEAAAAFQGVKQGPLGGILGGGKGTSFTEAFQKPRSTHEIRYKDAEGNTKSFLEMDRSIYGGIKDSDIEEIRATPGLGNAAADKILEMRETVRGFDAAHPGWTDDMRVNLAGRPLDYFELAERAEAGHFDVLTGNAVLPHGVWQSNLGQVMAQRVAAQSIAGAKKTFLDEVVMPGSFEIRGDPARIESLKVGASTPIGADGIQATFLGRDQNGVQRFQLGNETYRFLNPSKIGGDMTAYGLKDTGVVTNRLYPEAKAEGIERFHEQMRPENLGHVIKAINAVNRAWRVTTLSHPAWSVGNIIGGSMLYAMGHTPQALAQAVTRIPQAVRIVAKSRLPGHNESGAVELAGRSIPISEIMDAAREGLVFHGNKYVEAGQHILGKYAGPEAIAAMQRKGFRAAAADFAPGEVRRMNQGYEEALIRQTSARGAKSTDATRAEKTLARTGSALSTLPFLAPAVKAWFGVNGAIDDTFRLASFMQHIDEGMDYASAAEATRRSMLNFADMTTFESKYLRTMMPFYSWIRASFPLLFGQLRHQPKYAAAIPKIVEALDELGSGEESVPRHMRPSWIQQQLGIQIGKDPELRSVFTLGTLMPHEQAISSVSALAGIPGHAVNSIFDRKISPFDGRDVMDGLDTWAGQIGVPFKVLLDLANKRESFSGRSIGAETGEGDLSMNEYLFGQVRQLRELGVGSIRGGPLQKSFEQGVGSGVARLAVGGRLQPGLQEERLQFALKREMGEMETGIRKAIRVAEREGNQEASVTGRAKLLRLYENFLERGIDPQSVPKWARNQLAELATITPEN